MSDLTPAPPRAKQDDTPPLPRWLMWVYAVFPIVIYIPDVIFNYYVYAQGVVSNPFEFSIQNLPFQILWFFLAIGLVGMSWLLSVLAPWHWWRKNYAASFMCWIGVLFATSITVWNSLSYRLEDNGQKHVLFPMDTWGQQMLGIPSLTTLLVAVAPPVWGLFWAIVQPAERKRSLAEEQESHQMKLERLRQEAELKRLKAETTAQIREAQMKGLASTMRAARQQIGGGTIDEAEAPTTTIEEIPSSVPALPEPHNEETDDPTDSTDKDELVPVQPAPKGQALTVMVAQIYATQRNAGIIPSIKTIADAIQEEGFVPPNSIDIARELRELGDQKMRNATRLTKATVRAYIQQLKSDLITPTLTIVAQHFQESEMVVKPIFDAVLAERKAAK